MLRRVSARKTAASNGDSAPKSNQYRFADVVVDLRTRTVTRGGKGVELSPMEFDFLTYLIDSDGVIVSRQTLMRQVWRYSLGVTSRTVDQHVARLRNKLEPDPSQPKHLITVRKAGYRFQK
jgi:DNA-binding response OmpR family regulator